MSTNVGGRSELRNSDRPPLMYHTRTPRHMSSMNTTTTVADCACTDALVVVLVMCDVVVDTGDAVVERTEPDVDAGVAVVVVVVVVVDLCGVLVVFSDVICVVVVVVDGLGVVVVVVVGGLVDCVDMVERGVVSPVTIAHTCP